MSKLKHAKRFLALLLMGFFIASCQKEELEPLKNNQLNTEVSIDLASKAALNYSKTKFFREDLKGSDEFSKPSSGKDFSEKKIDNVFVTPESDGDAAFYIITFKPTGFVIISATKKEEPVLAFSQGSPFDMENIPYGLQMWIDVRIQRIQEIKKSEIEIPQAIKDDWDRYVGSSDWTYPETGDPPPDPNPNEGNYSTEKMLPLNTKWEQINGYNAHVG